MGNSVLKGSKNKTAVLKCGKCKTESNVHPVNQVSLFNAALWFRRVHSEIRHLYDLQQLSRIAV